MTTLPPLIESSSSERARELLRAARADGPRSSAAQRTLAALGVVGSTTAAAGAALGSAGAHAGVAIAGSAAGAAGLPLMAVKWLVVGTLSGLALASGATLAFSDRDSASSGRPAAVAAPAPTPRQATPGEPSTSAPPTAPAEAEPAVPEPQAPAPPAKATKPSASSVTPSAEATPLTAPSQAAFETPEQSKLLHDVALLDDVRHALQAGDAAQALSLVSRYEQQRQTHVLDREAEVLRQRAHALGSK